MKESTEWTASRSIFIKVRECTVIDLSKRRDEQPDTVTQDAWVKVSEIEAMRTGSNGINILLRSGKEIHTDHTSDELFEKFNVLNQLGRR